MASSKKTKSAGKEAELNRAPKNHTRKGPLTKEFVTESDEESTDSSSNDSSESNRIGTPPTKKVTTKSISKSKESSLNKGNGVTLGNAESNSSSSDSSSDSDSDSSSDSTESERQHNSRKADASKKRSINDAIQVVKESALENDRRKLYGSRSYGNDFAPPAGFLPSASAKLDMADSVGKMLSNESTGDKQIWHITAPSKVSLEKLQDISLQAIKNGNMVISHKDINYHFTSLENDEIDNRSLAIPRSTVYKTLRIPITKSLRLQQALAQEGMGADGKGPELSTSVAQQIYTKTSPPKQPSDLKMRYQPFGVVEKRPATERSSAPKRLKHSSEREAALPHRSGKVDETQEEKAKRKAEKKAKKDKKLSSRELGKTKSAKG